jgi:DNA-binding LytR/AlgR family response regulator
MKKETIKTVIIDDEPLALTVLESLLKRFDNIEIVGKFSSAIGLKYELDQLKPDVIFSDIQMPGMTGLEFIKSQYPMPYAVIFTTAHANFAAEAFEFEALDYLMKPISPERIEKAIKRLEEYIELRESAEEIAQTEEEYVYVKVDGEFQKIFYKDIPYVEAFADYVKIWVSPEKRVVTLQTMRNMESGLPSEKFIRVHRSYIVSIDKITAIQNTSVIISGSIEIPIGKNYKDSVSQLLHKNKLNS